jgi:O-antigen ligase
VPLGWVELIVLAVVLTLGFYLLYATQLRNAYLGLTVFFIVFLYFYNKWLLAPFVVLFAAFIVFFWSAITVLFFDFFNPPDLGPDLEIIGSGRKTMWTWALEGWRQAPLLNQITGMGVNYWDIHPTRKPTFGPSIDGTIRPWPDPHNDFLFVLLSLGAIGLVIFVGLFGSILRAILAIPRKEKSALLGLFLAVMMMNVMSNSYITNFVLFQMFFMLMVYVDLKSNKVVGKI